MTRQTDRADDKPLAEYRAALAAEEEALAAALDAACDAARLSLAFDEALRARRPADELLDYLEAHRVAMGEEGRRREGLLTARLRLVLARVELDRRDSRARLASVIGTDAALRHGDDFESN
jgi:hypothetical protein